MNVADLIEQHFAKSGYLVLREVANGTGSTKVRAVDFVVLGIWPSRGFEVIGVEQKTARSDWLRELAEPAKADACARHCDSWYIAATAGVVKEEELPTGWGLILVNPDKGTTRTVRRATSPNGPRGPLARSFVMSLIRNAAAQDEAKRKEAIAADIAAARAEGRRLAANENKYARDAAQRSEAELRAAIKAFEDSSGLSIQVNHWRAGRIGEQVKRLDQLETIEKRLRRQYAEAVQNVDAFRAALTELAVTLDLKAEEEA